VRRERLTKLVLSFVAMSVVEGAIVRQFEADRARRWAKEENAKRKGKEKRKAFGISLALT